MELHALTNHLQRRAFLRHSACGLGSIALASLLCEGAQSAPAAATSPLAPQPPHFRARAKPRSQPSPRL